MVKTAEELNRITAAIVDAAYGIHSRLGPGLLESVYEILLATELIRRGFIVERQKAISFVLDGVTFDKGFIVDLIIDGCVIVEIKAAERLSYVFERQLLTYLKVLDLRVGLLLNFGAPLMKDGIRRLVNRL